MPELLCLSGHAVRRSLERGISLSQIENVALYGRLVSCGNGGYATYELGRVRVVIKDGVGITVFRKARENPKRAAQKERQEKRKQRRKIGSIKRLL